MNDQIDAWETAREAFRIEANAMEAALSALPQENFLRAVQALASAKRISASGCGHSGIACMHFAHLMCCIERPARFLSPSEAVHGATGFVQKDDVVLLASRGGKTSELLPILDICQKKGRLHHCRNGKPLLAPGTGRGRRTAYARYPGNGSIQQPGHHQLCRALRAVRCFAKRAD